MHYYLKTKITAFTTTRELNHLPLSFRTNEVESKVFDENSNRLSAALTDFPIKMVYAHQTHSANIADVDAQSPSFFDDTDGLITKSKGICLCIRTADCTPVILYDEIAEAIGVVHAGWKGTALNISGKLAQMMITGYKCRPENIKAVIGPCISKKVYEVGTDVFQAFSALPVSTDRLFTPISNGKYYLDLKATHQLLLIKEGIAAQNILTSEYCTWLNNDQFFSARKDGFSTGRMVTGIFMQP